PSEGRSLDRGADLFRYGIDPPYLYWAVVGADGTLTHRPDVIAEVDRGYMIHDFLVTADFVVLIVNPVAFDFGHAAPLSWEPERGTRIALIPRGGSSGDVRWIETDAFWCWHYANAWQEGGEIVTCFPWWSHLGFGVPNLPPPTGYVARGRIDPAAGTFRLDKLDDRLTEFPRVDDRRLGRPTRYAMFAHKSPTALNLAGCFDELLRFDDRRGAAEVHPFPGSAIGEAVFAPKAGRSEETAGYILTIATDRATLGSSFVVLDAEHFSGEPVAVVQLPRRVPLGLHGNWYPADY
ncbi:MAG: carotenoid oxygenase family protein, partial [Stellaceae bacterium]